jgi:aspartate ammonia-lyase
MASSGASTAEIEYRMEHDLIGDEKVPKDAYYGIQTQRA